MADAWISLVSGVAGGLVVAVGTLFTSLLKSRAEKNRELLSQACRTALADFSADSEHVGSDGELLPLSTYIYFHFHFFKLLEAEDVSARSIATLKAKGEELSNILEGSLWRDYVSQRHKRIKL
ncbi:MAG: hypothetical protein F6K00_31430 [Leptolyngbya sp. SIOISBB]|nr:hypothetical protein [Leptolyngbya sp. SIOISBB]